MDDTQNKNLYVVMFVREIQLTTYRSTIGIILLLNPFNNMTKVVDLLPSEKAVLINTQNVQKHQEIHRPQVQSS